MRIELDNPEGTLSYDQQSRHGIHLEYKHWVNDRINLGLGMRYNHTHCTITFDERGAYADESLYRRQQLGVIVRPEWVHRAMFSYFINAGLGIGRELESRFYSGSFGVWDGNITGYHTQMTYSGEVNVGFELSEGPVGFRFSFGYLHYSPLDWSGVMSDFLTSELRIQTGIWINLPKYKKKKKRRKQK